MQNQKIPKIIKSATKKSRLKNHKNLKIHTHTASNPNKFISLI